MYGADLPMPSATVTWFPPAVAPGRATTAAPRRRLGSLRFPFAVRMLLVYLGAITIIGKGPTYLGVPPIYWGEMVMSLLAVWTLRDFESLKGAVSRLPVLSTLLLLFMTVGAGLTA